MPMYETSSSAYGAWYGVASLPPRNKIAEPQLALLTALASPAARSGPTQGDGLMAAKARRQAAPPPPAGGPCEKCEKCDGPHPTNVCPHFRQERDQHEDSRARPPPEPQATYSPPAIVAGRIVPQPGDGSCLFHSLAHCLGTDAGSLRSEAASAIEANPTLEISGSPLSKWILWDSGLTPPQYVAKLRSPGFWGGALEIAVLAAMLDVLVYVYEPASGQFKRIASFGNADESSFTAVAHIVYRGRSHYDALQI